MQVPGTSALHRTLPHVDRARQWVDRSEHIRLPSCQAQFVEACMGLVQFPQWLCPSRGCLNDPGKCLIALCPELQVRCF